jgi:hypothetical protein
MTTKRDPDTPGRTTPPAARPPLTMADILARKRPPTVSVSICVDPELVTARDEATRAAQDARRAAALAPADISKARAAEAASEAEKAARGAAEEATVEFVLRALPRSALAALLLGHAPTEQQVDAYRAELRQMGRPFANERPQFNPDTFPPALIAAACVSPAITADEAGDMWHNWTDGETKALFLAAWEINAVIAS